ncbi:ead/Ea22-like family protein [Enterobacter roggenkampii]|uniref:ead/Ea22-like family protein n=1 Tax=Enterobacter roggenkampii TaxID=1812935 RepID=UPI00399A8274
MSNIDKRALREAAEKATPGRIGDRIDGSGSIKYQCFGNDGSLVLQTDHKNMEYGFIGENSEADELFFRLCDPVTVLALLDELEAKDKRIAEQADIIANQNKWVEAVETTMISTTDRAEAAEKRIAELEASHGNLREAMAGIHNTITGGGAYMPLASILNASKRAYEESAAAAGKGEAS